MTMTIEDELTAARTRIAELEADRATLLRDLIVHQEALSEAGGLALMLNHDFGNKNHRVQGSIDKLTALVNTILDAEDGPKQEVWEPVNAVIGRIVQVEHSGRSMPWPIPAPNEGDFNIFERASLSALNAYAYALGCFRGYQFEEVPFVTYSRSTKDERTDRA